MTHLFRSVYAGTALVMMQALIYVSACFAGDRSESESILRAVDVAITNSITYEKEKLAGIETLKKQAVSRQRTPAERYDMNRSLFLEYESLVCDSALRYIDANISLARDLGREDLYAESVISKAMVISKAGLFHEALDLLDSIDVSDMSVDIRRDYYTCLNDLYQFLIEYEGGGEYSAHYRELTNSYKDSILALTPDEDFAHVLFSSSRMMDDEEYVRGSELILANIDNYKSGTREFSILSSILAFGYRQMGDRENELKYYALAAISDIEGVVKENMAMRALAERVFKDGDYDRAHRYIQKSIEDANYFSARMRKNQSALMLPIVSETFQASQSRQRHQLTVFLVITTVLAVGLIFAVLFIVRQLRTVKASHRIVSGAKDELQQLNSDLTAANKAFETANSELSESNCIKEEYIARFLELCSKYLSMLEQYRRNLYQLAVAGKTEELHRALKSNKVINETINDFYSTFDAAFLNIFPDFVERVNDLLPDGAKINLKSGERLNTELRIFALVRLGITDSAKIADFLRCSITTIYTYRSKVKNRSIVKGDFESEILRISSF